MALEAKSLNVDVEGTRLVDGVDFSLAPGELKVMIGPNGAGKTSFLRAVTGVSRVRHGDVTLDEIALSEMTSRERAQKIGYLPQMRRLAWPAKVRNVVALGRFAYGGSLGKPSFEDKRAVGRALNACNLMPLADRDSDTLSGGEQARMHLARALSAETPFLIADEPVASLDPHQQFAILDVIETYVNGGGAALLVLHDLSLAARYATSLIWMKSGKFVAEGPPAATMTPELIGDIFDVSANVEILQGRSSVQMIGRSRDKLL